MGFLALDDRDPAIVYSPNWTQQESSQDYNSTTTSTSTIGANANVTFVGSGISVFGTIQPSLGGKPVATYTMDGGEPFTFEGSPSIINVESNQLFYRSPALADNVTHVLTITNTGDAAPLVLDLLLVTPPAAPLASTMTMTTTATMPVSTVTASQVATVTVTASGSAAPSAGSSSSDATGATASSSGKLNTAAMVGGIIGAVLLLLLLVFGVICYRRRQRKASDSWAASKPLSSLDQLPLPLAPQFQSQRRPPPPPLPPMSQMHTGSGHSGYEQWVYPALLPPQQGGYLAPQAGYNTPPRLMTPQTDTVYYDNSEAYGGIQSSIRGSTNLRSG